MKDKGVQEFGRECIPPHSISSLCLEDDGTLYFLGGSPTDPVAIWKWELPGNEQCRAIEIVSSVDPAQLDVLALQPFFSVPQLVEFPNKRGSVSYGYLYLPNNLSNDLAAREDWKPPLLVKVSLMSLFMTQHEEID